MNTFALEFLSKYSDWIKDATLFSWILHWIQMGFIRILYKIASFTEGLIDVIYRLTGFLEEPGIDRIYNVVKVLSGTVFLLTIIFIAFQLIMDKKVDWRGSIFRSLIFFSLIGMFPAILNKSLEVTETTYNDLKNVGLEDGSTSENLSLSYRVIQTNLADLSYLSTVGFSTLDDRESLKNDISEENFSLVDLNEILLPEDLSEIRFPVNQSEVDALGYKLKLTHDNQLEPIEIKNGWFSAFDEGKFRFTAKTMPIMISLLTLSVAFIFSAFIIGASLIDLVFAKILFPILAVSDISTGQRVKGMFVDIGKNLAQIMLTSLSLSVFTMYFAFISQLNDNIMAYLIACVIGVKLTIDGPKAFGKYFGIDVGVRDGWKTVMGLGVGAKMLAESAKGAGNLASSAKDGAVKVGSGLKNMGSGASDFTQKSIRSAGHASERGVSGFIADKYDGSSLQKGVEVAKHPIESSKNALNEHVVDPVKNQFKDGQEEGSYTNWLEEHVKDTQPEIISNEPIREQYEESLNSTSAENIGVEQSPVGPVQDTEVSGEKIGRSVDELKNPETESLPKHTKADSPDKTRIEKPSANSSVQKNEKTIDTPPITGEKEQVQQSSQNSGEIESTNPQTEKQNVEQKNAGEKPTVSMPAGEPIQNQSNGQVEIPVEKQTIESPNVPQSITEKNEAVGQETSVKEPITTQSVVTTNDESASTISRNSSEPIIESSPNTVEVNKSNEQHIEPSTPTQHTETCSVSVEDKEIPVSPTTENPFQNIETNFDEYLPKDTKRESLSFDEQLEQIKKNNRSNKGDSI